MAIKITAKKTRKVNNRPNCLKITKRAQKVNLQVMTLEDGTKVRTTTREMRTLSKASRKSTVKEAE